MKRGIGIRVRLTAFFLVPVLFIVLLGAASYSNAASALKKNYEESALSTVESVGSYFELVFSMAKMKAEQMIAEPVMMSYYGGAYESGSDEEKQARTQISSALKKLANSDGIVGDLSVLPYKGRALSSNGNYMIIGTTAAEEYDKSIERLSLLSWGLNAGWIGTHSYIDGMEISPNDYCITYTEPFYNFMQECLGYVSVDVRAEIAMEALSQINLGEESVFALVAPDGTETTKDGVIRDGTSCFFHTSFYRNALGSGETEGCAHYEYDGVGYLYIYDKISDSGAMICGRIPESTIVATAANIRVTTILVTAIAGLFSLILGVLVSTGYGKVIKRTASVFEEAAAGDLTVRIHSKRRDEFGMLANAADRMMHNMKKLINKVSTTTTALNDSATELADSSEHLVVALTNTTRSVEEIRKGIVQQAEDSAECLDEAEKLTEKIGVVRENVSAIEQMASVAQGSVDKGMNAVSNLKERAAETTEVTQSVILDIEDLAKETQTINHIIATINDIAEQTNLLSLNASIEAARAGEAGRGFSVVAEEIRKLAEQSAESASEIAKIIVSILGKTEHTVQVAKRAESIVSQQEEAVLHTMTEFKEIGENVAQIAGRLQNIGEQVADMEQAKQNTLQAIESISAVSEETSAASGEVEETAGASQKSVENLNEVIQSLKQEAAALNEELSAFKVEAKKD
ncbi:MAG: methyl-accepting chemotaxis protein [Lachnospiraceae bacterium]